MRKKETFVVLGCWDLVVLCYQSITVSPSNSKGEKENWVGTWLIFPADKSFRHGLGTYRQLKKGSMSLPLLLI